MSEVTLDAHAAAAALGITEYDLALQLRKAAVTRLGAIADQIKDPRRDRDTRLDYFDEFVQEARNLLAAAEACDKAWWDDLGA